jgi:ankyrin repeat protein
LIKKNGYIHVDNDTALNYACESGHLYIVEYLIESGANIHAKEDYCLVSACYHKRYDVIKCLLEKGADIHIFGSKYMEELYNSTYINFICISYLYTNTSLVTT